MSTNLWIHSANTFFPLINMYKTILVGVYRGGHPPPPPSLPEMTYGFLIQLVFCKIWRYVWYVFSAVHIILLETLSKDDDNDNNNNIKKKLVLRAKQLLYTCITLFSKFLWRPLHDYDVKTSQCDVLWGTWTYYHTFSLFYLNMDKSLKNSTPLTKSRLHLNSWAVPSRRDKVWKDPNSFFSDVFTAVVVVVA